MAGTLFGLPLSQQLDANGNPQSGCLLYLYEAQTSTPVTSYSDAGLVTETAFPIEADASGRIPQFWLNDGTYRARLTTAGGVEIFDEDSILALGPSVASTGGGGGTGTTTTGFTTGDMKWKPVTGTETGWVRANARTIGSASSGGTERASSDTQTLYEFLWNNFSNTLCPVTTGRGGSALADFAANKSIATLDMRGYLGGYGLDDMGNSAVGRLTTGTPTSAASATGAETTSLILATANLPSHTHSFSATTSSNGAHSHDYTDSSDNSAQASAGSARNVGTTSDSTSTDGAHTHTVSGTSGTAGSGTAYVATTISPGRLGTWYIKL